MMKSQAKKLTPGERVFWKSQGWGTVNRKRYNTVWIIWDDDGFEKTHYAERMHDIFTQPQLDSIEEEKKIVAKIEEYKAQKLKEPARPWYETKPLTP